MSRGLSWWTLSPFSAGPGESAHIRTEDGELVDFSARVSTDGVESRTMAGRAAEPYRGDTEAAMRDISELV
ncbi:MAG: hypothetical protein ACLGIF_03680, partial [Actinomycetes bacterium]